MRDYASYFDYEFDLGSRIVAPFLATRKIPLSGKSVLDVGCGEGGVLAGLASQYEIGGTGIDYDENMISRARPVPGIEFLRGDFYNYNFGKAYNFILLRDVLEHCGDPAGMLSRAATLLSENGHIYITYTPFLSPFGGHQHNGTGFFSNVPYIQLLPWRLFIALVRPRENIYKGGESLIKDLGEIRRTRLTTGSVRILLEAAGLSILYKRAYLVRPDYRFKFGLPTVPYPASMPIGTFTDGFSTCVELLVSKSSPVA